MSATALVVIVYVFYKILNTHNTLEISMSLYLHSFHHFRLFFENLGTERTGGISKLVVVVDMVLNFLITDKSIMAERSFVPSQVSKYLSTSAFSSIILVQKGQGKFRWSEDESEVYEHNTPFSLLRCQNVVKEQNLSTKIWNNKTHLFEQIIFPTPI